MSGSFRPSLLQFRSYSDTSQLTRLQPLLDWSLSLGSQKLTSFQGISLCSSFASRSAVGPFSSPVMQFLASAWVFVTSRMEANTRTSPDDHPEVSAGTAWCRPSAERHQAPCARNTCAPRWSWLTYHFPVTFKVQAWMPTLEITPMEYLSSLQQHCSSGALISQEWSQAGG